MGTMKTELLMVNDRRKSALVEYALIAVAFCAILLAIVVFSRALHTYHSADNAAHGTVSYAIVRGS